MLLELVSRGLSYREARELSCEEVLCLAAHSALLRELEAIAAETARVAGLPFAEPHEQQRLLHKLRHSAALAQARFHREVAGDQTGSIGSGSRLRQNKGVKDVP